MIKLFSRISWSLQNSLQSTKRTNSSIYSTLTSPTSIKESSKFRRKVKAQNLFRNLKLLKLLCHQLLILKQGLGRSRMDLLIRLWESNRPSINLNWKSSIIRNKSSPPLTPITQVAIFKTMIRNIRKYFTKEIVTEKD